MAIALVIVLAVAGLHLVNLRAWLTPELRIWHRSYFSDVVIPFAFYFLLCFTDDRVPRLRSATAKGLTVFLAATAAELLQGLGVPLLGRTFDPWDIGMYALGTVVAALTDALVLSRLVPAWPLAPGATGSSVGARALTTQATDADSA